MVNDVSAFSGISSREQAVNSIPNNLLYGASCKNDLFPHFLFFSGLQT